MGWGEDPAAPTNYFRLQQPLNIHGLPLVSVLHAATNGTTQTLVAGVDYPLTQYPGRGWDYFRYAPPVLRTVTNHWASDYRLRYPDFWSLTPPPDHTSFDPLATPPLLFASVDDPGERFYGWARMAVANGSDTNVHAYVARYFDTAYRASVTNGQVIATTNRTGVLSEYGDFYATEPGPVFLTTRPLVDDTGATNIGQLVVHSLALGLDANHNGGIGLNLRNETDPDWFVPFRHWVNADADDAWASTEPQPGPTAASDLRPDYSFQSLQTIGSIRDLEDFARLWLCGVPTLPANQGYTVGLSWGEPDHWWEVAPKFNLFISADPNGGTGHLVNPTNAAAQIGTFLVIPGLDNWPHPYYPGSTRISIGTVAPGTTTSLPLPLFATGRNLCLLFEGATAGAGRLVLTIRKDGKIVGQTSRRIEIHDIKDIYGRMEVVGLPTKANRALGDAPPSSESSFVWVREPMEPATHDTNVLVFVHGYNMTRWEAQNFSETAFKRLWCQGYSGRFIGLRWPTVSSDDYPAAVVLDEYLTQVIGISTLLPAAQFQVAEYQALRSGKGTALALLDLKQRYPDCARHLFSHSLGALVMAQAGNELKSLGGSNVLSSYVVCQGALDARAYDPAAPDLQRLHPTTTPVSRNYRGLAAGLSSACGRIVNFQNENDFALATGRAALNALLQPNGEVNWQFYQIAKKPRGETTVGATGLDYVGYEGDGGTNASYVVYSGGPPREYFVNRLAHPFESTAFAAKAESKAVGSGSGFGNLLSTSGEFDLGRPVSLGGRVGLNDARNAHSGQFNWHNYQVAAFYEELIRQTVRGGTP